MKIRGVYHLSSVQASATLFFVFCVLAGVPYRAFAATWADISPDNTHDWKAVAASADGVNVVAATSHGHLYLSHDSGAHWTDEETGSIGLSHSDWAAVAMSADGSKIVAAPVSGYLWVSTNSGSAWVSRGHNGQAWSAVTMSADGAYMAAASAAGYMVDVSVNGGTTWTQAADLNGAAWDAISFSPDGSLLVAAQVAGSGYIAVSTNHGTSWDAVADPGTGDDWYAVKAGNGGYLTLAGNGNVYTSFDSGETWNDTHLTGDENWQGLAASNDLATIAAASGSGYIHLSENSGSTWDEQFDAGSRNWQSIALSDTTGDMIAAAGYGGVWFYDADGVEITAPGVPPVLNGTPGLTTADLTWNAPDSDGGSAITDYLVEYKRHGDDSWNTFAHDASTETSITVTSLESDTNYDFRVSAVNAVGTSEPSEVLTMPTSAVPPPTPRHHSSSGSSVQSQVTFLEGQGRQNEAEIVKAQFPTLFTAPGGSASSTTSLTLPVRDLAFGMRGDDVRALQQILITQHTGPAAQALAQSGASGYFGALTRAALIEYQKSVGIIPAPGRCGPRTRAYLKTHVVSGLWW